MTWMDVPGEKLYEPVVSMVRASRYKMKTFQNSFQSPNINALYFNFPIFSLTWRDLWPTPSLQSMNKIWKNWKNSQMILDKKAREDDESSQTKAKELWLCVFSVPFCVCIHQVWGFIICEHDYRSVLITTQRLEALLLFTVVQRRLNSRHMQLMW